MGHDDLPPMRSQQFSIAEPKVLKSFWRMSGTLWLAVFICACLLLMANAAHSGVPETPATDISVSYWVDASGQADIAAVAKLNAPELSALEKPRPFDVGEGALWLRLDVPALDASKRWFVLFDPASFSGHIRFYQMGDSGQWQVQEAGTQLPVAQWAYPSHKPLMRVENSAAPQSVWVQLQNFPTAVGSTFQLLDEYQLKQEQSWVQFLLGGYLGFGLLVLFLGYIDFRLYGDKVFLAYVGYVGFMLMFQLAFTGVGGYYFWPDSPTFNRTAPAIFMLWLSAAGIWFVREACAIYRYHRTLDRLVIFWSILGLVYPAVYFGWLGHLTSLGLNLYGLLSVLLSIGLCLWAWKQGERYAGLLFLGFLPVHLGYPFPALRAAGVLPDSWLTEYAVLIGSAIEIPLLLYILHRRAKEYSENRVRFRALDTNDALTGLTIQPVLLLRMRDAMRRAKRYGHQFGVLLVDLSNHGDIAAERGREVAERSLVVSASKLSRLVRDVDTVCRIENSRFAVLVEGPRRHDEIKLLAQHIVARGLEKSTTLPQDLVLRFRIVSAFLPHDSIQGVEDGDGEDERLLRRLSREFDKMSDENGRVVLHLPRRSPTSESFPEAAAAT